MSGLLPRGLHPTAFKIVGLDCHGQADSDIGWVFEQGQVFTILLLIALLALVGVFIEIPFVTNSAFWVLMAGRK